MSKTHVPTLNIIFLVHWHTQSTTGNIPEFYLTQQHLKQPNKNKTRLYTYTSQSSFVFRPQLMTGDMMKKLFNKKDSDNKDKTDVKLDSKGRTKQSFSAMMGEMTGNGNPSAEGDDVGVGENSEKCFFFSNTLPASLDHVEIVQLTDNKYYNLYFESCTLYIF